MDLLLFPFRLCYKVYYFIVFCTSLILFYPILYFLLANPKRFHFAFRFIRFYAFLLLLLAGVILIVKGKEHIPKNRPFIICSNHSSFLDPFCFYLIFKNYFVFVGKKEIEKWPLFHIFYTSGMNILIDRSSSSGALIGFKRMIKELDQKNPIVIFPEGTRSKISPRMEVFKTGAFAIAIQKQVPILPISFIDNWKRLQTGGFLKGKAGPGIARVIIHKPLSTSEISKKQTEELQQKIHHLIEQPILKIYKKFIK